MRAKLFALAIAAFSLSVSHVLAQDDAVPTSSDVGSYFTETATTDRYVEVDGLLLQRLGTGNRQVLAINTNNNLAPGANTLLRTSDLNFDFTPGARVFFGWRPQNCDRCSAFEVGYFGLYNSVGAATVTGNNNLAIPGPLGLASNDFFLTDIITARYGSTLHNVEWNCVKSCCFDDYTRLDVIAGFRYIRLDETFDLTATDFQEGTGVYHVGTQNNLLGVQVGGRSERSFSNWSVQLSGKAGVFVNAASETQFVIDDPVNVVPFFLRPRISGYGASAATVADLSITAIRPINDVWSVRFGYMALGIGGLALAPDQLDFNNLLASGGTLNTNGYAFYHGGFAGLQAEW